MSHAEQAPSLGAAADALRPDPVELPGAMRWVPGTTRTRVAANTIRDWIKLYRDGGFEALYPKARADRGQPRRMRHFNTALVPAEQAA